MPSERDVNEITGEIVDAAMKVHTALGPGLLESAYQACLVYELRGRGLRVIPQARMPIRYDGVTISVGYRVDMLVEDRVLAELKATSKLHPIDKAQLLSYLKLSGRRVGLLLNFHVPRMKDGITRMVRD